jgi:hypothetical protein
MNSQWILDIPPTNNNLKVFCVAAEHMSLITGNKPAASWTHNGEQQGTATEYEAHYNIIAPKAAQS